MTTDSVPTATTGWDEAAARDWVQVDRGSDRFAYPWQLAATLASHDDRISRALDVASGPGGFLATVLDAVPEATGVWFDFSETMRQTATENLARFGDRVSFVFGDIVAVDGAGDPESFDLVTSSRATHHLVVVDLGRFYATAASRLKVGGWIANLDTFNPGDPWNTRLRELGRTMSGRDAASRGTSNHPHLHPAPSLEDHLACLRAAGFERPQMVWSSLMSGLLMAKKAAPPEPLVRP